MKHQLRGCAIFVLYICFLFPTIIWAQSSDISLRLNRDFGASTGAGIRGTFSYRVEVPDNVVSVQFLLDGEVIAEDMESPFRYQFQTQNFAVGRHTLQAVATTTDGTILESNVLTRTFVSQSDSMSGVLWVLIPLLMLSFGGRWLTGRIAKRNNKSDADRDYPVHGMLGGTICPSCQRPFAFHIWSFNLIAFRIDRCPHCGTWSRLRRMNPTILEAAYENAENLPPINPTETTDADDLDQRLDDSRFTD